MIKIWSKRWNPARGNYWQLERESKDCDVQEWLKVFRGDEPMVCFLASKRRPHL